MTEACKQKLTYGLESSKTPAFSSPLTDKNLKTTYECGLESNQKSQQTLKGDKNIPNANLFKKSSETIHDR